MRTYEIVRAYAREGSAAPVEQWERLLWMAAELIRLSQKERKTFREKREMVKEDLQMELPLLPEHSCCPSIARTSETGE